MPCDDDDDDDDDGGDDDDNFRVISVERVKQRKTIGPYLLLITEEEFLNTC